MTKLTRRRFVVQASIGAGAAVAAGAALAAPALQAVVAPAVTRVVERHPPVPAEPVVLHVRDMATSTVAVTVGTREVVFQDRDLVQHLLASVRRSGDMTTIGER
jgi:hypothetical protein